MKWSFFSKKRLDFCGARSTTASPKHDAAEEAPLEAFAMARDRGPGSLYVGTKLCEASSDGSGEFLTSRPPAALSLSLPVSPEEHRREEEVEDEEEEEEEEEEETEVTLPATPCSIRSCPEPEQILGFCPNCQSVVVPLAKKRPHIRTNPWLSGKRQRLQASRLSGGGKSDGASVDALEAPQRQGTATSVTDSGIFDASPTNSALEPKSEPKPASLSRRPAPPCDSSEEEETLRRRPRRRRRRKKAPRRCPLDENRPPLPAPREGFCLPQSDTRDLWEVRGPPETAQAAEAASASEEAQLDAEVQELSRRRVAAVRGGLQERIAQLRSDRQVLEQRLRAARDCRAASGQREALWAREAGDYRKQLLLRLLSSARGQVDRHLDRLQESYDALLAEKLAVEREARAQRARGGGLSPEEMI